jgi:hypothetical protein
MNKNFLQEVASSQISKVQNPIETVIAREATYTMGA